MILMPDNEVKSALSKNNLIIGGRETIKYLKNNKIKLVMISKTCPENIKKELERITNMQQIKIESFDGTSKQFGTFLGKPFSVSAVSVKSEHK